ncbi:unnamed protein product [Ectocarpus sp. 6 AP-2014]
MFITKRESTWMGSEGIGKGRRNKTFVSRDFKTSKHDYENEFPWFWIDMETTGLDTDTNLILEIVMVVTDRDLNEIDSMRLVLHHPHSILLARSSAWCRRKFCHRREGGNGLFEACHFSALSHHEAEYRMWNFFDHYSKDVGGRVVDVSTPLEMVRRWRPDVAAKLPRRNGSHRAYDDILDSISLMKFFKETFLNG